MPKWVRLRQLTTEEQTAIKRLANSRTEPIRLVQRARIIQLMLDDPTLNASEAGLRAGFKSNAVGPVWVKRFNETGAAGLQDEARPGRPAQHDQIVRSKLISLALQKPRLLGLPFELWTLERLQTALQEREGIHLSDSTIWSWLDEEGLQWKRQQSWFQEVEQHDPEFVEKRGPLSRLT
jgi:transposase